MKLGTCFQLREQLIDQYGHKQTDKQTVSSIQTIQYNKDSLDSLNNADKNVKNVKNV